jgi:multicomponent Na+:H+ antiporter subunit D
MEIVHPALIFFVGAVLIPFFKGKARNIFVVGVALVAFVYMLLMEPQTRWVFPFLNFNITLLHTDRLSLFVGYIFVLIGLLIILYSIHVKENEHHIFSFLYIGSSLGVVFAGDFLTFFIFWEMLAVTGAILIWIKRDKASLMAGFRYLIMHLIGGGILLIGILLHFEVTGSMEIGGFTGVSFALILTGIGFKAAFIPLHTWLPDAYPKASFTVSVLLSVFTTKAAVYALARLFPGVEVVAYMGGVMALYGVVLALRQNNARKLLSYHIISQVGYMVAGVGIGTQMGIDGGLSHVWNHILYKSLLFMCIGAVIYRTGKHNLTQLGGLSRKMPITTITCIIASLSISGVPLFNGFVSKSMVYEAAHYHHNALYWMLKLASVGTFLSFCKFTYFGFLRKREIEAKEAPITMTVPMVIAAFLCVLGGVHPNLLGGILPHQSKLYVYALGKFIDTILLLGVASAIFFFGKKMFIPHQRKILDFDYIYIRAAGIFMWFCRNPVSIFVGWIDLTFAGVAKGFLWFCKNPISSLAGGVDSMFALVARIFVGTAKYSPMKAFENITGWMDRLSLAVEEASNRRAQREKMAALAQGRVDVRNIDAALLLVALMLALFLLYLALKHLW